MIESSTKPNQILVIDDNQAWLNSLSAFGIQVFNCKGKSHRALIDFVSPLNSTIHFVVVNLHLIQETGNSRSGNHGLFLVNDLLHICYPQLKYIFIHFTCTMSVSHSSFSYTDFLTFINTNYHGK